MAKRESPGAAVKRLERRQEKLTGDLGTAVTKARETRIDHEKKVHSIQLDLNAVGDELSEARRRLEEEQGG